MRIRRAVRVGSICVAVALLTATSVAIARAAPAASVVVAAGPATEPAVAEATVVGATKLLTDKFTHLTVHQILDPGFWRQFAGEGVRWAVGFLPRLVVASFLIAFFWVVYRIIRKLALSSMRAAGVDESIRDMLGHLLKWVVLGFGFIIAGNQIGLEIAALLTGVSIIGLAVGFAAQESLSNFIAGIMIFLDKPFQLGDWIEIDGHVGQVRRVTFRSTRLTNLDGDGVVLPNLMMLSNKLVNRSANPITRVHVSVGIAYGASIDLARRTLVGLCAGDARIEQSPAPRVAVMQLSNSSVDLELRFWIREEQYEDAMQHEYTEKAKLAFDAAGVAIPYPHVQLVMDDAETRMRLATTTRAA